MKKSLIIYSMVSVVTSFAFISCTDESEPLTENCGNGTFRLSSGQEVFTRASETTFHAGTAFQLYAVEGNDFRYNYLKEPASEGAVTGREATDHQSIENIPVNKFNEKTLNFYAITNSTSTPVTMNASGSMAAPTCNIEYKDNQPLTDVMWAKKENQTYKNSGTIKLMFGHTLAKLNLFVMKNSDYERTDIYLQRISFQDYPGGELDLETGKYKLAANNKREHKVEVLTNASQLVSLTAENVKNGEMNVTPMIFPTRKENLTTSDRENHSLRMTITVKVGNSSESITQETEITSILAENAGGNGEEVPFDFQSNHEYDMVITVTGSSLVVTIVPRVYEWVPDENIKIDSDVNGSMTIGGITWMDRNLGATSGNPLAGDQAWENSRGYYYQYGRNIPYYVPTKTDRQGVVYAPANGNWHLAESMPYPYIPGYIDAEPINASRITNTNAAKYPTDKGKNFNFYYSGNWDKGSDSHTSWNTSPCPKGWRIPTKDEFQLIIPGSEAAGDIPLANHEGKTYLETVGSDPVSAYNSIYVGVKSGQWNSTTVGITNSIYALKKAGTKDAYYLRWHVEKSGEYELENSCTGDKGDPYRNVLVISRYPATSTSTLTKENVATIADWNHPVEQIKLPVSGYIHTGQEKVDSGTTRPALIYSGSEAVYWTSSIAGSNSYTVRMKFAGDAGSKQIMMYGSEDRSNGCLIRCVRDTKAN